ncbi:MAG: hypothetical protein ACKVWR_21870 [Acidimicrobiales bacterium]
MANSLLKVTSNTPGAAALTLLDGTTSTGYTPLQGVQWSPPSWDTSYSGPRGRLGAVAAGARPQNRVLTVPVRVNGDGSQDTMWQRFTTLAEKVDEIRRHGGTVTWRAQGQSYRQHFQVMFAEISTLPGWDRNLDLAQRVDVTVAFVTAPFAEGDPMDYFDPFVSDTVTAGDWTLDEGTGTVAVAGGRLTVTSTATKRMRHTVTGYLTSDVQVTAKGVAAGGVGVALCMDPTGAADTMITATADGTNLVLAKRIAGTPTTLGTVGFAPGTTNPYWVRVRREGRRVTAEAFTTEPSPLSTPAQTTSATLTESETGTFESGHVGMRLVPTTTGLVVDDFKVEPFTYRNQVLPEEWSLRGQIPGDAPARADLHVTPSGGSAAPIWALAAWAPRICDWNRVWNGDWEDDANGWSAAAITGVTGAATSITRQTSAPKYGTANGQLVCPATANTGCTFAIYRRFKIGRTYLALVWVQSAGTTNARSRLGMNGDIASGTTAALTTTLTLRPVAWTPSADRDVAYFCFEITAATGTTINLDGISVVEARIATLSASISSTSATSMTITADPTDLPKGPFLALIDTELVYVNSVSADGLTWNIARGAEGTVAATHSSGATVYVIDLPRPQLEGKGAPPPITVLEAEQCDIGHVFGFSSTIATDAAARMGVSLQATALSGAGSVAADWLIDPSLIVPDEHAAGEVAVEAWARVKIGSGLTNPAVILAAAPETATVSSGVFASSFGQVRYSDEHGTAGRFITKPSSGDHWRFVRLGTIRLPVDPANPLRWRLQFRGTHQTGTSSGRWDLDYLVLVPALNRCSSPTLKADDSSYPDFVSTTSEVTKIITAELAGQVIKPGVSATSDAGLGGQLIEIATDGPGGAADLIVKLSSLVADDPTSNTNTEQEEHAATVHLAVTPRFLMAKGALS